MRTFATVWVLVAVLGISACSATDKGKAVSLDETQALFDSAKYSGASIRSPYEFHAAEIYLNQAAEELEKGNQIAAQAYLAKANEYAAVAYENAKRFRKIELQ